MNNYCLSQDVKPEFFSFPTEGRPHIRHYSANDMIQRPPFYFEESRKLRFTIALEAVTAVTQRVEESSITYLNRGQLYMIQLSDPSGANEVITSTLSIDFHNASHRNISENYWKYWLTQQKQANSRALDIDLTQSAGILDVSLPSFDKITFTWNASLGAKVYIRFKCLSTDFSRMKGVKGIPLRAQMESKWSRSQESSYCKIKLFRDKGAERKNKDDAKQITKQLEKVYGKENIKSLSLLLKEASPYTFFSQIPNESTKHHTRIMTAPNVLNQGNMMYTSPLFSSSDSLFTSNDSLFTENLLTPPLFTPSLLFDNAPFQPDLFLSPEEVHTPFYFSQPKLSCFRYDDVIINDRKKEKDVLPTGFI